MSSNISDFTKHQHIIGRFSQEVISVDEVVKLANLAKIKLSEEEKEYYAEELTGVINWLNKLNEVKIDKFSSSDFTEIKEITTDKSKNEHTDVLSNTSAEYHCFTVPKIINNE